MSTRRAMLVSTVTVLSVLGLVGPAFAGGRPVSDPLPGWLQTAIVVALLVVGALYVSVVAFGIAHRGRRH